MRFEARDKIMLMDKDFEKFLAGPTKSPADRLHVSLNRNNVMHFNNKLYRLMGKPESICLYYSRTRNIIGMLPISPRMNEGFPVKPNVNTGYRINISPFCRHFGIRIDSTIRFIDPEVEGVRVLLKLSNTVGAATVRKRKRKTA